MQSNSLVKRSTHSIFFSELKDILIIVSECSNNVFVVGIKPLLNHIESRVRVPIGSKLLLLS